MTLKNYFCGHCGAAISATDELCPQCSATLSRIRCPACKFTGSSADFQGDRCPKCGCRRLIAE